MNISSYWKSEHYLQYESGCKEYIIKQPKGFVWLVFSDAIKKPLDKEAADFFEKNAIDTVLEEDAFKLIGIKPIDGFNAMIYRTAMFYNRLKDYKGCDINKIAEDIEYFSLHERGVKLYLKGEGEKHEYAAENCTGPINYYGMMKGLNYE